MGTTIYNSKIDWWIPVIVLVSASVTFIGPLIDGKLFLVGLVLGVWFAILEIVMFASVKYQVSNGELGVRNCLYKWEWFPIDKISEIKKTKGILSAQALSAKRVSIRFADRSILKSSMPMEISPKDRDGFMAQLKEINPDIEIKER